MRKVVGVMVLAVAWSLSGCLVTDQRLPANDTPSADSPLLGLWQSPWPAMQTKESLSVTFVDGADHYVAVRGRSKYMGQDNLGENLEVQETVVYRAYPSRVGQRQFFSLLAVKSDPPVYAIVEAVFEEGGRALVLREPTDDAVQRGMREGRLAWRIQEDSEVVTSSGEDVAAWLAQLSGADFRVHQRFERWPAPIDDLQNKLTSNPS